MAFKNGKSCLFGCGTTMLLSPVIAALLFLIATLIWKLSPQDFSSRQHAGVPPIIFLLSACSGLGAGMIVYALTRKKPEQ